MFSNTKVLINSIKNYKTCSQRPLEKLKNKKSGHILSFICLISVFSTVYSIDFWHVPPTSVETVFAIFVYVDAIFFIALSFICRFELNASTGTFFPVAHLLLFTVLVISYWSLCVCISDTCIVPSHSRCWMRRINFIRALFLRMAPQMSNTIFHQLNGKGAEWTM